MFKQIPKTQNAILLILGSFGIFFNSCQKDGIENQNLKSESTIQFRTTPPENFQISEWIDCYNEVSLPGITFETSFGLPSDPIHYISGENEAMIYPLIMQNQIENLFFITHEEEPIIINREDGLSVVDLQNPALSINILEIFNLALDDLADSNVSIISSKLIRFW